MAVLITGGAGYIGSHTAKTMRKNGNEVVIYDNLSTGHREAAAGFPFVEGDIQDTKLLKTTINKYGITDVLHFAGSSIVGESMAEPQKYYLNNVCVTLNLLQAMMESGVKRIVFSSSAAVYGEYGNNHLTEESRLNPTSVYGRTKLMVEQILEDYDKAYGLKYISLRYFNACGADESGLIGEDHNPETHLIPLVLKTALGQREKISIFGDDYPVGDGSCIRDYVHVNDLALAHFLAMDYLLKEQQSNVFNLGNGTGFSVKQVIKEANDAVKKQIPCEITARREGDPAVLVADASKARSILGWNPRYTDLKEIIETAWLWHSRNPQGF